MDRVLDSEELRTADPRRAVVRGEAGEGEQRLVLGVARSGAGAQIVADEHLIDAPLGCFGTPFCSPTCGSCSARRDYRRNFDVVLSASTLPPV